jgi:hypothetical protein
MKDRKKQPEMTDEEFEEMRKRALQPFKPSLTDDDIHAFEEKVRAESLRRMKENKEELNDYEKAQLKEKTSFIHHFANNQIL